MAVHFPFVVKGERIMSGARELRSPRNAKEIAPIWVTSAAPPGPSAVVVLNVNPRGAATEELPAVDNMVKGMVMKNTSGPP